MALDLLPDDLVERLAVGDVEPSVGLEEFFDPAFMREHTAYADLQSFWADSPWTVADSEDLADVPTAALDDHVAATTDFDTWLEMRNEAAEAAVVERLTV